MDNRCQSVTAIQIKAQESCVPTSTKKATSWCLNVWKAWRDHRKTVSESDIPSHLMILATNKPEFCWWLCHFVLEVRRQDGLEYPPNSLHQLCCGILRYAREREPELDIFHDPALCHCPALLVQCSAMLWSQWSVCHHHEYTYCPHVCNQSRSTLVTVMSKVPSVQCSKQNSLVDELMNWLRSLAAARKEAAMKLRQTSFNI